MVVGTLVGQLTRIIIERISTGPTKTFCISFSLGAHFCGFVGKEYKLTGIIALDPSKLISEASSEDGRLAKNDAEAVFVFHTGYEAVGVKMPIGDVDFYVNGGRTQEFECERIDFSCSHMYAYSDLFYFAYQNFCGTNVFCPPVDNANSISGIKFPQIDDKNVAIKDWTTPAERSSVFGKGVSNPN